MILSPKLRARLKSLLRRAGRREIGGILMAEQLAPGNFRLVDFSVDNITGRVAHFCRNPEQHAAALERFFVQTGHEYSKYNYLGEWHSHPGFSVEPSLQDISSMTKLVRGERNIDFSVLMIVKLNWMCFLNISAVVFSKQSNGVPVLLTKN